MGMFRRVAESLRVGIALGLRASFFFEKRGAFWFEVVRLRFGSAVGLQGMGLVLDGQLGLVRLAGDGLIGNLG